MRLIDTHCHIQFNNYDDDREEVIRNARENEVGMIVVGCDYESSGAAVELIGSASDMWAAVGQHPTDTADPFVAKKFAELASSSRRVVAIGECGLDYYHLSKDEREAAQQKELQKDVFYQHLNLAHECRLPLIIHCRDAHDDLITILEDRYSTGGLHAIPQDREHGVLHCFTGTVGDAERYLALGFLISFTGIVTFADQYDDVVRTVPLEKILIETDAPFLSPVPHRGKKNEPANVAHVAQRIADIKGISAEDVAAATTANARRLFRLSGS